MPRLFLLKDFHLTIQTLVGLRNEVYAISRRCAASVATSAFKKSCVKSFSTIPRSKTCHYRSTMVPHLEEGDIRPNHLHSRRWVE